MALPVIAPLLSPMLCVSASALPANPAGWVMQPKFDGYRALAHTLTGRSGALISRNGRPLRAKPVTDALAAQLPAQTVLDAELVCLKPGNGGQVVQARGGLPSAMSGRSGDGQLTLVCFDALMIAGEDLRTRPWTERDAALRDLLSDAAAPLTVIACVPVSADVHQTLIEQGFEGSVLKRADSPYRSGRRSRSWVKIRGPLTAAG